MNLVIGILRAVRSLRTMVAEMNAKGLELGRITKTASTLITVGMSRNSIPQELLARCFDEQRPDGGWVGVVDTMWNLYFMRQMSVDPQSDSAVRALAFLNANVNQHGMWGRSPRDMSRIPVSGMMLSLLPDLANVERLQLLEDLWASERNSLTYKAAYVLMAFRRSNYQPRRDGLLLETISWLVENQRRDGSFGPWIYHPASSDVFCTGVAVLGLACYPHITVKSTFERAKGWLLSQQLPQGIWPYHEIEDGASWGVWALTEIGRVLEEGK